MPVCPPINKNGRKPSRVRWTCSSRRQRPAAMRSCRATSSSMTGSVGRAWIGPQALVVNEAEAEWVWQIYPGCVEEQLCSYAIHHRLTAHGIPPRKAKRGQWAQSSVIEILRDSLYKGEAYYNRTQPGDVRRP